MRFALALAITLLGLVSLAWSAQSRTADAYYRDAAYEYVAGRMPSATLTCEEGFRKYPGDKKLQMLLDRIRENKEEQKKKCNNPQDGGDQGDKDKNNQDKEKQDKENQDSQGQSSGSQGQSSGSQGKSSDSKNQNGQSSGNDKSSDSKGKPEDQNGNSSAGGASSAQAAPMPMRPGELSKDQAEQMLRDFNQNTGERKAWKPVNGKSVPEKDW